MSPAVRDRWLVAALATLPLLPFLDAAVSIDAPVFVAVAQQVAEHPLDPFGFELVWDPTSPRVYEFNHNPPLLSYWLAPVVAALGAREWAMHLALLPFPLVAALCLLGIARRLRVDAAGAAALLVCTPAFLLLASTLLLDVPLLAFMLLAVYALLRANESGASAWEWLAGAAAAAAGLTKYVGFSTLPLLAAGLVLLPAAGGRRPARWLRLVGIPLACWGIWGAWTLHLYGAVHFAGGVALAGGRNLAQCVSWSHGLSAPGLYGDHSSPSAPCWRFWNQALSVPVFYGAALGFPLLAWLSRIARGRSGTELAAAGLVAGAFVMGFVLPKGLPTRRAPLDLEEAALGAFAFAGAVVVWGLSGWRALLSGTPQDRFLLLWLGGLACFSVFVNWHVNAADALLAAPPAILLLCRQLAPSPRTLRIWLALLLPLSLLLTVSDVRQRDVYREVAVRIANEIGDAPGSRWLVGQWGFQYYLARQGFRPVLPPQYAARFGRSELAPGDWVATARNVSQLDVKGVMARYVVRPVRSWRFEASLPLRATNPDAGGGFYSHQSGFVPIAWSWAPLEEIGLGRVVGVRGDAHGAP